MRSEATDKFWKAYYKLPDQVQKRSNGVFSNWKDDPWNPIFHFKCIHKSLPIYSVRVGIDWRALGRMKDETVIWFWIGSHEDYNKLINQLK